MMIKRLLKHKPKRLAAGALLAAAAILIPSWEEELVLQRKHAEVMGLQHRVTDTRAAPELAAYRREPEITARAALAYDYRSGSILFAKNFDQPLPMASLTKLLSALVVLDHARLDELVEVQETDTKVIGANAGLIPGEEIRVSELLKSMLIASHNDATLALARHSAGSVEAFVAEMNEKSKQLGLESTRFANPIGLDDANHYSSARDLSLILNEFYKHEYLAELVRTPHAQAKPENLNFSHQISTTNKLLLEDETIIGVKTGYTTNAKGNLAIRSVEGPSDVATIVLGSEDREADSRKILDWVREVYRW